MSPGSGNRIIPYMVMTHTVSSGFKAEHEQVSFHLSNAIYNCKHNYQAKT